MITFNLLQQYTQIAHFCTTRSGGVSTGNFASYNLSPYTGDDPLCIAANTSTLCHSLGITSERLIVPFQTHQTELRVIHNQFFNFTPQQRSEYLQGVDALCTRLPGICIAITTADCVPLQFFDPVTNAVAVAHAGWRGSCAGIAAKTIGALTANYGSKPQDIRVVIGPSISSVVYQVGIEVVNSFSAVGFDTSSIVQERNGLLYLDLWKANQLQLLQTGLSPDNIQIAGICTYSRHDEFFSARRLGIQSGRILTGIMLKK